MSKKSLSELFKRWSGRGRLATTDFGARNRARLRVEEMEHRVVPATLPPVTATDTRVIQGGAFAPQAVADPTNPNLIVVISAPTAAGNGVALNGQITRDGGQTWSGFGIANPDTGGNAGPGGSNLTMVNTPGVAFSRTGDLYVIWTSTTADQTSSGRLRVASFSIQQNQPATGNGVSVLNPSVVLYQWHLQDPVFNPTIAVDNNLDEYTDPDTAAVTIQDTMLRANNAGKTVYAAWNTSAVTPTESGHVPIPPAALGPFTPTAIFAAGSRDRGATWSTPVPVNDGGFFTGNGGGIAPQIRFTPGDLNANTTDTAGQLQFFWQRPGGAGVMDITSPDEDQNPATNNIDVETSTVYQSPVGPAVAINEAVIPANGGAHIPTSSSSKITVAIDNSASSTNGAFFNFLTDIDVTVAITHPHLNQISVVLSAPNGGPSVTLVSNQINGDNSVNNFGGVPNGLADNNGGNGLSGLGVASASGFAVASGTVFDSEAARRIYDPANVASPRSATSGYIAHYKPEFGTLGAYYGMPLASLNGQWTLTITDFRDDDGQAGFTPNLPTPVLNSWSMKMSSLISNSGFGADSPMGLTGAGATANLGGAGGSNATATGFNAGYSYAYDNTLGSFSPFSGRLYTAFTTGGGNIVVASSDDQGANWSFPTRVNDDFSSDNFSEGNRSNFMPSIAVDSVTGTVVVTWYDARWDASNARVATYIATSIDGGDTWSVQDQTAWLNNSKDATDQLTREVVSLEPMPTNLRAIGAREAGQRQSLIAAGGQIHAFWTGNENTGGGNIYTATVQTSAGPRVVDNDTVLNTDQGAVTIDAPGAYNNTFTADGTRRIDGFTVTFDRLVDTSTFGPTDVTVLYRAPGTDRTVAATKIPIIAIVPLDPVTTQAGFPDDATQFFVQFATPQTAPGTYSYAVGPTISDRVRSQRKAVFTAAETPTPLPDLSMVESTISVPLFTANPTVANMEVKVDIDHTFDGDLKLTLFGPDPDGAGPAPPLSIVLSNRNGGSGNNYFNTRFRDSAVSSINAGAPFASPPFTGTFKPEQPLATFNGTPLAGNWTLRVEDLQGGDLGTIRGWSITFLDAGGTPITVDQSGTFMDQDGDSKTNEIGTPFDSTLPKNQQPPHLYTDAYTAPGSSGADQFNVEPFAAPVTGDTLPLISTGPHLVLVGNPGERAVVTFATRDAANPAVLHVTLDRAVDITTFDQSDVISVVSAAGGQILAPLTAVIPTNDANEIASKFDFVYQGSTLPTGKYSVSLGTNFLVADGMFRNTSSNQMLVRFDRDIDPATFTTANVIRITGPIGDIEDVQDITVLGSAGTFKVTFDSGDGSGPQTTGALPFNIPASGGLGATSSLQNAIAALSNVGSGNVVVTVENLVGGGRTFHVSFTGLLRSSQPPLVALGTGGTTATVQLVGITVTPVPTTVNAVTGGARAFFVTYPKQSISGPYSIEFGQDPFGNSIRAVDVPQLVAVHYTTPIAGTDREGAVGTPEIQTVRVPATSGTFTLTFNGQTTAGIPVNATASQVQLALNALTNIGPAGAAVIVSRSGQANDYTYTIQFTGTLASSNVPQMAAAFTTLRDDLTVVFNRNLAANEFTTANIASTILAVTGPNGAINISDIVQIIADSPSQYRIRFNAPLPAGQYVVDFNPTLNLKVLKSGPSMDMNFNAGLETLRGDAPTSQDLDPVTFRSTGAIPIAVSAPNGPSASESYIVINDDYIIRQSTLEQIRVLLNISHPDVRDLDIDLVPPDATGVGPIRLFSGSFSTATNNVSSANFQNTVLVDRVGDPSVKNIEAGTPPFLSGDTFYSPQTPLSQLVGKSAKGVWTLRISNNGDNIQTSDPNFTAGDPIEITNWALTLPKALTVQQQKFERTSGVAITPATVVGPVLTPSVISSSIQVPVDFTITETTLSQIQMLMNIQHPNVRDLDIDLIPPAATGVNPIRIFSGGTLAPTAPNVSANFTNTRLVNRVDPSTPNIQSAVPPFNAGEAGFFSPQNPLTALIGKSTIGTWTLRVTNRGQNAPTSDPNFNPNAPIQIANWSISFPKQVATTGLGESTADRFQAAFRIFTQDPTNTLTQTTWTPVGPAPTNETANSARISAMAVDPTDPTGNTVYVAVAGGGIWKTTDFLNSSSALQNGGLVPRGPSYVPLTDFGPTSAVNVSSIAVFPRNNDPHQSIILALTGEPATEGSLAGPLTSSGVGVIRSLDGGKTWQVLDSSTNVDAAGNVVLMSDQNTRDHLFVGATGYKIVVDPVPGKDGGVIVYMALTGNANQNGLWRSLNGGNTWTRMMAGNATDVVLSAGSANVIDSSGTPVYQGNLQNLYAGFRNTPAGGPGVYKTDSAPAAFSLQFMGGGTQNPLIQDIGLGSNVTTQLPVSSPGTGRNIALAAPALTGNPLQDSFLKDWLYAMTTDPAGAMQLYMTKDAGAHWTRVRVPNQPTLPDVTDPVDGGPTNNESNEALFNGRAQADVGSLGDYAMAIAVDPSNPYIVYMAGEGVKSIRLDLTKMRDAHNFTFYNESDAVPVASQPNPAFTVEVNGNQGTIGGFRPQINFNPPNSPVRGEVLIAGTFDSYVDENDVPIGFLNLFAGRDYNQPFAANSLTRVFNTSDASGGPAGFFVNDGADISWSLFTDILDPNVPSQTGDSETENRFSGINTHTILSITDPVTGKTRLIFGTDDGVFTGVDAMSTVGTGTLTQGIGFSSVVNGNRNGNLQTSQFYSGAVQPSQLAADLAGALFYAMGDQSGFPVSSPNILASGDLNWRGPTGHGASVLVDQAGSGTAFEYRSPSSFGFDMNQTATSVDFFRVMSNQSDHAFGGGVSRTGSSSGSLFDQGETWPNTFAYNPPTAIPQPTANPANAQVLMFGSPNGRVYRSLNQGQTWVLQATPANLDGTGVLSVAFGSADPAKPTLTNNFMYAGTLGGRIFSTTTGGAPWTLIGSTTNGLDGQDVIRIIPNPTVGKKDVFALTTSGVFWKADGTVATGSWVPLVGNMFNLTRTIFGNPADTDPALKPNSLTALAVDWRYPLDVANNQFPILYVGGDGGVFRSKDFGVTWSFYPDVATDGAPADGGYLPNTHITDLDLSIGDLDPATGRYKAGGFNMLVATTYGRGTWAIRLDPNIPASSFISGPRVTQLINPNPVGGPSATLNVRFSGAVDPATFTPEDVHLVGPGGVVVPITSVNMISTPDANGVNPRNLFQITFPAQTGVGSYDITIGYNPAGGNVPLISDPSGFLMNQDNDTQNGESVVDQYRNTILLNSATNNRLVVATSPATAVAGASSTVVIEARDSNDLLLNGVNGTLTLTPAPGTGTFTPSTATLVNGVATFTVIFQTAGPQTVNVTFGSPPNINATAWTTTVVAGAATQFVINPASSVVSAGATQSFTLTAQDAFGNTATTYTRTVTLTRAGSPATLPATVNVVNGTATFNGTFNVSGNVQITATGADPSNPPSGTLSGSANVSVSPGATTHLGVSITPGPYSVGTTATVTVSALDAQGNLTSDLNGTEVTRAVVPGAGFTLNPIANPIFTNGQAIYTITFTAAGSYTITHTATTPGGPITKVLGPINVTSAPPPPSPTDNLPGIYGVGTGVAGTPAVSIYNGDGTLKTSFVPFPAGYHNEVSPSGPGFLGGVRVAVGDVTGDGVADYIMGTGPSITASISVINGKTGKQVLDYRPFETFKGGVYVSVGDITGDGIDEIVMTPDEGGGPRVTVLRGGDFARIANFYGINDPKFRGGARSAVGDLNGDGFAELVVAAGFGGGPRISILDGAALTNGKQSHPIGDFFLFEPKLRNGAFVAVGDVDGDGFGDLIGGAGPGGGPRVFIISGKKLIEAGPGGPQPALDAPIANFFAGDINSRGGVRVAAKNIDGDRKAEVVTGAGGTDANGNLGGSTVTVYLGSNLAAQNYTPLDQFDLLIGYYGGVFVG